MKATWTGRSRRSAEWHVGETSHIPFLFLLPASIVVRHEAKAEANGDAFQKDGYKSGDNDRDHHGAGAAYYWYRVQQVSLGCEARGMGKGAVSGQGRAETELTAFSSKVAFLAVYDQRLRGFGHCLWRASIRALKSRSVYRSQ